MGVNNRLRAGVAVLGVAFVLAIGLGASGVLTPKSQRTALGASTTLAIISGDVQVRHGATGDFVAADDGMFLAPGDTVRTGSGARAVLTYFEGSTVEIEPNSQLAIDVAHGNPDGSTVIEMSQQLGTTWHVVTHLVQGGSRYEVHTTSSTASVRGTAFTVGVESDGTTTETTTEGAVANRDAQNTTTVLTPPGQQTTTRPGQAPEAPKPAPEPARKVTVTVGDQNTIVVDTLGRANGITKDGKRVLQTPGAHLAIVDGKLVVTLPNVPDGDITTHFQNTGGADDVEVTTKVEDQGKQAVEVSEKVKPSTTEVTGAAVKKTADGTSVELKRTGDVKPPKIGEIVPAPTTEDQQKAADDSEKNTGGASGKSDDKSGDTPRPAVITPKPAEPPKTVDTPRPANTPKPADSPRSGTPTTSAATNFTPPTGGNAANGGENKGNGDNKGDGGGRGFLPPDLGIGPVPGPPDPLKGKKPKP